MNRTGPVTLMLGALLLLASCSGEDADAEPTPSASASSPSASATSPTPSETPPTMPAQAQDLSSNESAAAFIDHYVDLINYAAHTGDVDPMARLSDASCAGCQEYVQTFRSTAVPNLDWKVASSDVSSDDTAYGVVATIDSVEEGGPAQYRVYFEVAREDRRITTMHNVK
ncbi:DUF6318 family protein [Aeromicrobium sp. IC_218]|uniref:DUF6318 family protein n=1 Tax=Aeromicrobium sp. IC_218 TaxID=2545468 RepID=UPI0013F3B374|nr:DUF6318 family protein [Aeromicrobium sp. IC_218]